MGIFVGCVTIFIFMPLALRGRVGGVITPGPEGAHKCLVYSLHDSTIETKHIGGAPHQNYDPGAALALNVPASCIGRLSNN